MNIPSSSTSNFEIPGTVSKVEGVANPTEAKVNGTNNIWVPWTPGSDSVKVPLKSHHRKAKTGCIRCRIRRVKVGSLFLSMCDVVCVG